jgi:hypothetical protein
MRDFALPQSGRKAPGKTKEWMMRRGSALIAAVTATLLGSAASAEGIKLATHRAVYDMTLDTQRPGSSVQSITGRMVYELTGNACDGWTQTMRFVTQMTGQDGQSVLSDLRSNTWEDAAASLFRFTTNQLRDQKPTETAVGDAKRAGKDGPITVEITRPTKSTQTLRPGTYFPVQHSIALLLAAKAGRTTLRADLYDGSEQGTKAYDTIARISAGQPTGANGRLPKIEGAEPLDNLPAWPVTISYYDVAKEGQDSTPVYELSFVYFENGVSRALRLDYGDFAIKGEMTRIEFIEPGKCEAKP